MSFETRIIDAVKTSRYWEDIQRERTWNRCTEVNPAIVGALNKNGIEAILVETHYPEGTAGASHYYALARDSATQEVRMVDGVVSSRMNMQEPFIGSLAEAKSQMKSFTSMQWDPLWNLEKIVVSDSKIPVQEQTAFRKKWGEWGEHLVFGAPVKQQSASQGGSILDVSLPSSGHVMTLEEMNDFALRRGFTNNYVPAGSKAEPQTEPSAAQVGGDVDHAANPPVKETSWYRRLFSGGKKVETPVRNNYDTAPHR
jgi:hypothetical protein